MAHQMKQTQEESPSRKKNAAVHPHKHSSRTCQAKRKLNAKVKCDCEAKKNKHENCEIPLSNQQDEEINQVMATIAADCQDQLGETFEKGIDKK